MTTVSLGPLQIFILFIAAALVGGVIALLGRKSRPSRRERSLLSDIERLGLLLRDYISEREATEEALHESEERYRSLIEGAFYGIYRSTVDGRFLEVNPALVRMLAYDSADELLAIDINRDLYVDAGERERIVALARAEGALPDWIEVRWRRKDGVPITVRLTVRPRNTRDGDIEYFETIAEDVTARQRQEELFRRSERMASLGTTLAGVAHELNNPLTAVIGFAQILLRGARDDDDRGALETIHREAARAARIVKDLLTFTRRQEGTRIERVDVNAVVGYIVSTRRYAVETRGARCVVELDPSRPLVAGDPSQIEQVVLNLLVNAEQALAEMLDAPPTAGQERSPRGEIVIATTRQGPEVLLRVSDTGCGIAAGDLTHIWDPFWTTKPEGEGTGLGLSVVQGILASHGGSIDVESERGAGTSFTVRFPLLADADGAQTTPATTGRPDLARHAARPLDVLVVDDETSITGFLERYLGSRGHAVLTAQNGPQAIALARQGEFDVVVCDLRMPGMDGLEVMRALRAMPNGRHARYILSTGATLGDTVRDAVEELRVAVVPKPYDVEQLRRAVEHA